jgi:hypothetical protein
MSPQKTQRSSSRNAKGLLSLKNGRKKRWRNKNRIN